MRSGQLPCPAKATESKTAKVSSTMIQRRRVNVPQSPSQPRNGSSKGFHPGLVSDVIAYSIGWTLGASLL